MPEMPTKAWYGVEAEAEAEHEAENLQRHGHVSNLFIEDLMFPCFTLSSHDMMTVQ